MKLTNKTNNIKPINMQLTHIITEGNNRKTKCKIHESVLAVYRKRKPTLSEKCIYITTEDGRSFWIQERFIEKLK